MVNKLDKINEELNLAVKNLRIEKGEKAKLKIVVCFNEQDPHLREEKFMKIVRRFKGDKQMEQRRFFCGFGECICEDRIFELIPLNHNNKGIRCHKIFFDGKTDVEFVMDFCQMSYIGGKYGITNTIEPIYWEEFFECSKKPIASQQTLKDIEKSLKHTKPSNKTKEMRSSFPVFGVYLNEADTSKRIELFKSLVETYLGDRVSNSLFSARHSYVVADNGLFMELINSIEARGCRFHKILYDKGISQEDYNTLGIMSVNCNLGGIDTDNALEEIIWQEI